MMIKQIDKPEGYDKKYRFFCNGETGHVWKASLIVQNGRAPAVDSKKPLSPAERAITVTVSPVDIKTGKALPDADGLPVVIDSYTFTFNEVSLSEENFDPEKKILEIIEERIVFGEKRFKHGDDLSKFVDGW